MTLSAPPPPANLFAAATAESLCRIYEHAPDLDKMQ
jgi:hypothetical protein